MDTFTIYQKNYATASGCQVQNLTILCLSGSEFKIVLTFLVLFVPRQKEQNLSNETIQVEIDSYKACYKT